MKITHESGRRTAIEFQAPGRFIRATWTHPYSHSILPSTMKNILLDSLAGDAEATWQRDYYCFNYRLGYSID